jgi:hypothetical protein
MGVGNKRHVSAGNDPVPILGEAGLTYGRSELEMKISPPPPPRQFDPRNVQPVAI